MAKLVAFNYDYFRNACQFYAEKNNTNPSAIIKENHLSNSIFSESLNVMNRNKQLFDFSKQEYVKYGAMYEDRFIQLCEIFELNKDSFVIQVVEKEKPKQVNRTTNIAIENSVNQMAKDIRDIGVILLEILERLKEREE